MPNWIRNRYTITALLVLICWTGLGLMSPQKTSKLKERALMQAEAFYQQCDTLRLASDAFKFGKIDQNELKRELLTTRHAYKRIEYLWEYLYPSYAEEHLNGAPLLHIERHDTRPFVIPPEGLQMLDEMIFADNASAESAQILILAQKLKTATQKLLKGFRGREISTIEIREAQRMELIRIFTLGLTGFDTPGSGNALAEAQIALDEMRLINKLLQGIGSIEAELRANQGIVYDDIMQALEAERSAEQLNLRDQALFHIDSSIQGLTELRFLNLMRNQMEEWDTDIFALQKLKDPRREKGGGRGDSAAGKQRSSL